MRYSFLHIIGLAGVVFVMPFSVFSQPFTDIAARVGVADAGPGRGVAWGDADQDGDLDLYLVNSGQANRLFRNSGTMLDGDIALVAGIADNASGFGAAWGDYDNDGDLDLYLARSGQTNRLYHNNGNGTFTNVAGSARVDDVGDGRGVAWGDYDNDGYLDLYLVSENVNRLYRNDGAGGFTEVGDQLDVDDSSFGISAAWGDFNRDGWLDLYVVNASQPNRLYRNHITGSRWLSVSLVGSQSNRIGIGAQTIIDSLIIQWPSGLRQVLKQVPTNQHLIAFEADAPADITGPAITLSTDIHRVDEQEAYTVEATITDHSAIQKALLLYRLAGVPDWTDSLTMTVGPNSRYSISIPSSAVNRQGITFAIRARDQFGNSTESSVQGLSVAFIDFQSDGFSLPASRDGTAGNFRMISVPAVVGNRNPVSILGASLNPDNTGAYDKAIWRLLRWNGSQYIEYPSAGQFDPGSAFWLIARDPATIQLSSATAASDVQRKVTLTPGWNQIGTPYLFPVSVSAILDSNQTGIIEPTFWFWNGAGYGQATTLKPWHGYWVRSLASVNTDLVIPRLDADIVTPRRLSTRAGHPPGADGWTLQLIASAGAMRDAANFAGVHNRSLEAWDPQDISEPPSIGEGAVSLSFLHEDWSIFPGRYAGDIRAKGEEGYTWSFMVESDLPDIPATVEVAGLERLPVDMQVVIIDSETSMEVNLQQRRKLTFIPEKRHERRAFTLIAGSSAYVKFARETLIPAAISLRQNAPNPFNPSTTIAFDLPKFANIQLRVLNILGQAVRRLVDETRSAGRHTVRWNGNNDRGRAVASGIYFYQLQVESFVQTRKMILLR